MITEQSMNAPCWLWINQLSFSANWTCSDCSRKHKNGKLGWFFAFRDRLIWQLFLWDIQWTINESSNQHLSFDHAIVGCVCTWEKHWAESEHSRANSRWKKPQIFGIAKTMDEQRNIWESEFRQSSIMKRASRSDHKNRPSDFCFGQEGFAS